MDITLTERKNEYGQSQKVIDFVSVTEKFDGRGVATRKAKNFLSQRLYKTISSKTPKKVNLIKKKGGKKASDQFLN
ncbi:MAG: hypothetical protein EU517_01505, partial [Promethearchaeota archaeon]